MAATKDQTSTILFTDVEGSTQLRNRRGDQLADEILRAHEAMVRRQVQAWGGREAAFLGDGFILTFSSAQDGLRCARGIQRALEEHNRADPDRQVRVRIGLHHGETTERDGTVYGPAVRSWPRIWYGSWVPTKRRSGSPIVACSGSRAFPNAGGCMR
jgi:class 3 adenylate cyclase